MSTVVPSYVDAVRAVIERVRSLLPRKDLDLEVRIRFLDRQRVRLSVFATRGKKEYHHVILEDQYMALRVDDAALDRAAARIVETLFPDAMSGTNGFRGVRYWTWSEKRLQEDPRGK